MTQTSSSSVAASPAPWRRLRLLRGIRQDGLTVNVVLVERRGTVGEGVAYSTRESAHLLNVPAGRISAWPDRPDDFLQWASRRYGDIKPTDFLPRTVLRRVHSRVAAEHRQGAPATRPS